MTPADPFTDFVDRHGQRIESYLDARLPPAERHPARLHQAMRYAVLQGGKRVRPLLVYACGAILEAQADALDTPAAAIELIHAYSLVHDDLPAMDDDDERRGRPSCHRAYNEATAILVGDALQSLAFQILAEEPMPGVDDAQRRQMLVVLARAAGSRGMAGGQMMDLALAAADEQTLSLPELENLHIHKTGALIRACAQLAALVSGRYGELAATLDHALKCLGLAFQIRDDVLDAADGDDSGPSYTALLGPEGAQRRAEELYQEAMDVMAPLGPRAAPLRRLARFILDRGH